MLEIAEPDDAALAVRRALVVARHKPFDADSADAAARKLIERRAAHRAEPDHDHVELRHGNDLTHDWRVTTLRVPSVGADMGRLDDRPPLLNLGLVQGV